MRICNMGYEVEEDLIPPERCHSALDYKTPAECYYPAMLLPYAA